MLEYLLLSAAVALGQPESSPPATTPTAVPHGKLTLEADPPAPAARSGMVQFGPLTLDRNSAGLPFAPPPAHSVVPPAMASAPPTPVAAPPAVPIKPPAPVAASPAFPVYQRVGLVEQPPVPPAPPAPPPPPEPLTVPAPSLPPPTPPAVPAAPAAAAAAPPPRYLLMESLQGTWPGAALDGTRTQILGWNEFSYTASSIGHNDLPESFNYRGNEPVMQQTWLRIARSVVTTGTTEPTWGFQSDWIFGTDYRFTLPQKGILNDQLTDRPLFNATSPGTPQLAPEIYGIDPVQFYAEVYFPTIGRGLDVKLGRFYTPYGVESLEAPNTPLVSHSYIFSNGSPFTHTGVLATLTVTPVWTVQGGLVLGSDLFIHPADRATGIFTLQWTQPQGTQSAARNIVKFTVIAGPARFDDHYAVQHINVFDVVWTHQFNAVLVSNLEMLYGFEHNVQGQSLSDGSTINPGFIDWGGTAGYLTYTFTPRLKGTARLELFDDPQGVRTSTAEDPFLDKTKGLYAAATGGVTWTVRKGLIFESELRYDYNLDSQPFGTSVAHPFDGHHSLLTLAGAMILRW